MANQQLALLPDPPRYWRDEASGVLAAAVEAYLTNKPLTLNDLRYLRNYCVQWVNSSAWDLNPFEDGRNALANLRESARQIHSVQQLDRWLHDAVDLGMDPL